MTVKWGPNLKFFNVKIFIGGSERFDTVKKGLELIKGTMNYLMFTAILGSSVVIAAAFLFFCSRWFEREAVLFRQ